MKPAKNTIEIYQLRVVLRETSPHIWRRFLVRSDSSIVDLHQTIQIALGWSGDRAYQVNVQGQRAGVRPDCEARHLLLSDFHFYVKERFTYEYNIGWQWVKTALTRGWTLFATLHLSGTPDPEPSRAAASQSVSPPPVTFTRTFCYSPT